MPTVAGWVDELRDGFDAVAVNAAIRAALDGQPTFFATEGGAEVGTPLDRPVARECASCAGWHRPGQSVGYCDGRRADLPPAYGPGHPLRQMPDDKGAGCAQWVAA
jgi:hypothetical protein